MHAQSIGGMQSVLQKRGTARLNRWARCSRAPHLGLSVPHLGPEMPHHLPHIASDHTTSQIYNTFHLSPVCTHAPTATTQHQSTTFHPIDFVALTPHRTHRTPHTQCQEDPPPPMEASPVRPTSSSRLVLPPLLASEEFSLATTPARSSESPRDQRRFDLNILLTCFPVVSRPCRLGSTLLASSRTVRRSLPLAISRLWSPSCPLG